jgi:hypothetical protein
LDTENGKGYFEIRPTPLDNNGQREAARQSSLGKCGRRFKTRSDGLKLKEKQIYWRSLQIAHYAKV